MYQDLLHYDLGPGVEAFTTRRDAPLPYPVIQGHQVHRAEIAVIDKPWVTREELEGYDAFLTNLSGVAIGVRTADCVPILMYDPRNRAVAAVHSGWKGTVQRIVEKTIVRMGAVFGTDPQDLRAVIGPCIGFHSFQVGEEVVEQFRDAGFPMEWIWAHEGSGVGTPMSGGHHIDLAEANRWLLQNYGIQVEPCHIDTFRDPSFFSARREGTVCGRNINAIRLV